MTAVSSFDARPFGAVAADIAKTQLGRRTRMLLERGDSPRSGERVWRNSYTEGTIEHQIWKPINDGSTRGGRRWTGWLLKAARSFEYRTRIQRRENDPGARNGALGEVGLEVLACLYELVDYASGRLEPAIATIAAEIGRSYSAVHDALVRLRREGFLHWMRRSRPIEDPEPGGPQVEQVPNAYALMVPEAMKACLRGALGKVPKPACDEDHRRRQKADYEAMLASLTTQERHHTTWNGDELLGETLRRLAAAIDRRDVQEGESDRTRETGGVVPTPG